MHLLGIVVEPGRMQAFAFVANVVLHLPSLWKTSEPQYGIDYTAYINQANQVANGQLDYTQLSSLQGPCFYPAGSIWHYMPVYYLHMYSPEDAVFVMKFIHFLVHSGIIVLMSKVACKYFEGEPRRAQLLTFVMIAHERERWLYQLLFNDEIMALYIAMAICLLAVNKRPLLASLALTTGLSLKAGVMLLVPAFLGSIQYGWGTWKLLASIIIIIGFQVLVAAPFVIFGDTSASEYLARARFAGGGRNGIGQASALYDNVGAHHSLSIFWTFLDEETYYSKWWNDGLKASILMLNIYHFFIRKWCLPRCLTNLMNTFSPALSSPVPTDPKDTKLIIELLTIGMLTGCTLCPGGHYQFHFWFIYLVPLAIEMVGLPTVTTCWIYSSIYPVDLAKPWLHHYCLLGLVFWLLTVGPFNNLLYLQRHFVDAGDGDQSNMKSE